MTDNPILSRFLRQTTFVSEADYAKNLEFIVPKNFNFAYDVVDAWAEVAPDKVALLWTNDEGEERRLSFADLKRQSDQAASYLKSLGINEDAVQLIEDTDRAVTTEFMKMSDYVDVLIPRGSAGLIKAVVENSNIPVIETGTGNCHIYVDKEADLDKAIPIIINAKAFKCFSDDFDDCDVTVYAITSAFQDSHIA